MSDQTILVIGATGMLGAPVARRLRQEGNRVRLLVRDVNRAKAMFGAEFEYVSGDVRDEAAVRQALTGVQGVYISLQGRTEAEFETVEHQGTALVARLAAQAGVKRIGYLSGALVSSETTHVPQEKAKYLAEESIVASGVPYTIFRPTMFMESLPLAIQGNRATVMGKSATRLRFIAAEDYAAMVTAAFAKPEAANQRFFVYGPEAFTIEEAMRTYCRIAAPDKQVSVTPFWMISAIDRLFMGGRLKPTIEIMKLNARLGEVGDDTATKRILGAPTVTLQAWCQQSASQQSAA